MENVLCILFLRNAKVVHVGECLLDEAGPLLGDPAHLVLPVRRHHLELHVSGAGEGAPGPLDDQRHVTVRVSDLKPRSKLRIGVKFVLKLTWASCKTTTG